MAVRSRPNACCTPVTVKALPVRRRKQLAALAKALSDPNRIEILRLLADQPGPLCACDVVDHFDLSQPTISHHLKVLRDAGLLRGERSGLWVFYEIDPTSSEALSELASLAG